MGYRKARTQHDEIRLWLTYSTYHNPAEKSMSINHTAIISINCTTGLHVHVLGTLNLNTENYEFPKRRFLTGSIFMSRGFNREYCNVCCSHKYDMWKYGKRYRTMLRGRLTNTAICQTLTVTTSSERTQIRMCLTGRSIYDKDLYPDY